METKIVTYNISKADVARNVITLNDCKSYASEANLDKALEKFGLKDFDMGEENYVKMRYIKCLTPQGRWTAVFLVSEFFRINKTGGYVGIASHHGFMSV
jgi:hypothetical protein